MLPGTQATPVSVPGVSQLTERTPEQSPSDKEVELLDEETKGAKDGVLRYCHFFRSPPPPDEDINLTTESDYGSQVPTLQDSALTVQLGWGPTVNLPLLCGQPIDGKTITQNNKRRRDKFC